MGLDFNHLTKKFNVGVDTIKDVADSMGRALLHIRNAAGLPLGPYVLEGALTDADHAQKLIVDAAQKLGITFGGQLYNDIDLRDLQVSADTGNADGVMQTIAAQKHD